MSSANRDGVTPSLSTVTLYVFLFPNCYARVSSARNEMREGRYICLLPNFKRNALKCLYLL